MKRATPPHRRFALDHNFPAPVLRAFATMFPSVDLAPIGDIDPRWPELADADLLVELARSGRWDGLITNDDAMLSLPREMAVLSQTDLTLVIARGEGSNPVRAVGVLLSHLGHICHQTTARAQIWRLRVSQKADESPAAYLETIAEKTGTTVEAILRENRLQ
jgi:hypothetical protein